MYLWAAANVAAAWSPLIQLENSSIILTYIYAQQTALHSTLSHWMGSGLRGNEVTHTLTDTIVTHTHKNHSGSSAPFRPLFFSFHQSCQSLGISHCIPPFPTTPTQLGDPGQPFKAWNIWCCLLSWKPSRCWPLISWQRSNEIRSSAIRSQRDRNWESGGREQGGGSNVRVCRGSHKSQRKRGRWVFVKGL